MQVRKGKSTTVPSCRRGTTSWGAVARGPSVGVRGRQLHEFSSCVCNDFETSTTTNATAPHARARLHSSRIRSVPSMGLTRRSRKKKGEHRTETGQTSRPVLDGYRHRCHTEKAPLPPATLCDIPSSSREAITSVRGRRCSYLHTSAPSTHSPIHAPQSRVLRLDSWIFFA